MRQNLWPIVGSLVLVNSLVADDSPQPTELPWFSRVQVGPNYTFLKFKPKGFSSFHGNLGGLQASYEYKTLNNIYAAAKLSWKQGLLHGGSAGSRSTCYVDVHERIGYTTVLPKEPVQLTLFTGVGYHYMGEKLKPHSSPYLNFGYNQFYIPVGFEYNYTIYSWFSCGLNFMWKPQVFSIVSIDPLKGAYWTLTKHLNNFYAEIPFDFSLTDNNQYHLIVLPFYEHWEDGRSFAETQTGLTLGLPGNTYNFWGLMANFAYNF